MAKLTFDLSGIGGLVERHQGDLNDTSPKPHLRYIGGDGQLADGIFNPMKRYGYMSPANNSYVSMTGTIASAINSMVYDGESDIMYIAEDENILKLDGLDDTSVSNYIGITAGDDIKDMVMYEINGKKALFYVIDSNDAYEENPTTEYITGGMYVGFKTIDTSEGAVPLNVPEYVRTSGVGISNKVVDAGSVSFGALKYRKLAQAFSADDILGRTVSGVRLLLSREAGTGAGITIKVSIQANATASTGAFTSRGAWSNAVTDYNENDTVTSSSVTWQCIKAHSAAAEANDEPGVGSNWEEFWNFFGAPDGTELASQTISLSAIENYATTSSTNTLRSEDRTEFLFSSNITLTAGAKYWIVVEESGSVMTASDECAWLSTTNGNYSYAEQAKGYDTSTDPDSWRDINPNGDTVDGVTVTNHDNYDFEIFSNRVDNLTQTDMRGNFGVETGQRTFLHVSENGLLYWVVGNKIHTINGSITGGTSGVANENVLQFADYVTVPDLAETRSRMYIAIQSSNITTLTDPRTYTANKIGVFVWDKRSTVLGSTDFYPCPGAKEIKSLFQCSDGSVRAITVGNSGFTEIRGINGNQFAVMHTLEKDGYPRTRNAVSQLVDMSVWLGYNGIFYGYGAVAPGEKDALYKLGTMAANATGTLTTGALLVGNEYASAPQQAVFFSWTDGSGSPYKLQKWYPNGEGTLNSVVQVGHVGDIYTVVKYLPELAKLNTITVYCAPTANSAATTIATAKIYINQSSTVKFTKTITQAQAARGYIHWELNQPNVNSIQIEFEPSTSQTLGSDDFMPSVAIVDYSPTTTRTPDGG